MMLNLRFPDLLITIISLYFGLFLANPVSASECNFLNVLPTSPYPGLKKLQTIIGNTYHDADDLNEYTYSVGICTEADPDDPSRDHSAIIQTKVSDNTKKITIGKYTQAKFMSGTNWMLLEYAGGQKYETHCGKQDRRGSVMILCDPNEDQGSLHVIEENTNKTDECYYLFELTHSAACPERVAAGISVGSISVIVLMSVIMAYFIIGFIYQRFVAGAKGWEQLPHSSFWQDFGNLQADGCELICRSGSRNPTQQRLYKGLGDDQLRDEEEDRDEHLLPM